MDNIANFIRKIFSLLHFLSRSANLIILLFLASFIVDLAVKNPEEMKKPVFWVLSFIVFYGLYVLIPSFIKKFKRFMNPEVPQA